MHLIAFIRQNCLLKCLFLIDCLALYLKYHASITIYEEQIRFVDNFNHVQNNSYFCLLFVNNNTFKTNYKIKKNILIYKLFLIFI